MIPWEMYGLGKRVSLGREEWDEPFTTTYFILAYLFGLEEIFLKKGDRHIVSLTLKCRTGGEQFCISTYPFLGIRKKACLSIPCADLKNKRFKVSSNAAAVFCFFSLEKNNNPCKKVVL